MAETFNIDDANATINSIEEMLDGVMAFSNTVEQNKAFTYEEYEELRALVLQVRVAIDGYFGYLDNTGESREDSYLTELLYGAPSRIDTIDHADTVIGQMEEVLGLNTEEEPAKIA